MNKPKVRKEILKEILKDDWDPLIIEELAAEVNASTRRSAILTKISDELPSLSAGICGVSLMDLVSRSRKRFVVMALKFCYKELYENHGCSYQELADRFNRDNHSTVRSALIELNNRLERGDDEEMTELYKIFKNSVHNLRRSIMSGNSIGFKYDQALLDAGKILTKKKEKRVFSLGIKVRSINLETYEEIEHESMAEAAEHFGISAPTVRRCCDTNYAHKGYLKFEFCDE